MVREAAPAPQRRLVGPAGASARSGHLWTAPVRLAPADQSAKAQRAPTSTGGGATYEIDAKDFAILKRGLGE